MSDRRCLWLLAYLVLQLFGLLVSSGNGCAAPYDARCAGEPEACHYDRLPWRPLRIGTHKLGAGCMLATQGEGLLHRQGPRSYWEAAYQAHHLALSRPVQFARTNAN